MNNNYKYLFGIYPNLREYYILPEDKELGDFRIFFFARSLLKDENFKNYIVDINCYSLFFNKYSNTTYKIKDNKKDIKCALLINKGKNKDKSISELLKLSKRKYSGIAFLNYDYPYNDLIDYSILFIIHNSVLEKVDYNPYKRFYNLRSK